MSSSKRPSATGLGQEPTDLVELLDVGDRTAITTVGSFDLNAGTMVGDFRIEQRIGEGAMGVVFAAVHPLIGKRAAIKVLRQELCADPFSVERFIDEARVVNQIGHPNIVDVFAFGQLVDGRHYFAMEWLDGEPLRTRLARARMSRADVCGHVRRLARALMAAHAKGVVHRDLKPDNVFLVDVDGEPEVKLLDFGIAKLAHTEHRMEQTASGAVLGTPLYIAPEQAKGLAVDHRADIYALGSMMFEMLTGRVPFVANSALEVIAMHLMEAPPRASLLAPETPRELDDLVVAMMAKDPAQRPSLTTVCEVIERAKHAPPDPGASLPPRPSNLAIRATPVGAQTLPVAAPVAPRSRRWLALALAAVVVGALAFVVVQQLGSKDDKPPAPPTEPQAMPTPAKAAEPPAPVVAAPPVAPPPQHVERPVISSPKPVVKPAVPKPHAHKPETVKPKPAAGADDNEMLIAPGTLQKAGK